jgi:predicted DNA-binding protein (MmcQ/YjbR family)
MTREEFDATCAALPAATHVVQWRGTSVWKVGGKIFALFSSWSNDQRDAISFKCSELSFAILTELPGIVPAPYLARASWVQVRDASALDTADLAAHLAASHGLVAAKLTRARRAELGLS